MKKITRNGFELRIVDRKFYLVDPQGRAYPVYIDFSSGSSLIYTTKVGNKLYTGVSPIELLETVVKNDKPDEYMNGFYDGVASVNHELEEKHQQGFDKGYKKAMGEAIAFLVSKAKEPLPDPEGIEENTV